MARFSVADAAFSGLKVFGARPVVFLAWYLLTIVMVAISLSATTMIMGPMLAQMQSVTVGAAATPNMAPFKALLGVLYLIPVWLLASVVSVGAANRAILKPQDSAFGYIRLGADELRLAVTLLVVGLILFLVYIVSLVGLVIVAAVVMGAFGAFKGGAPSLQAALGMGLAIVLGLIPVAALILYVAARFSLSTAQTIHTRSIRIFGSWPLTKGHSGKIVLTLLLSMVVYVGLYLAGASVTSIIVLLMGGKVGAVFQPDLSSLSHLMTPSMVVYLLVMGLTSTGAMALLYSPGAYIYQRLTGGDLADVF